jgi:hypothetical protein
MHDYHMNVYVFASLRLLLFENVSKKYMACPGTGPLRRQAWASQAPTRAFPFFFLVAKKNRTSVGAALARCATGTTLLEIERFCYVTL